LGAFGSLKHDRALQFSFGVTSNKAAQFFEKNIRKYLLFLKISINRSLVSSAYKMDDNEKFVLNKDCFLEIMKYIISDSDLDKGGFPKCKDLINFLLSHEIFLELFKTHYKSHFWRIKDSLSKTMVELLIDLRVNKLLNKSKDLFWRHYLQDIRKNMDIIQVQLVFEPSCVLVSTGYFGK